MKKLKIIIWLAFSVLLSTTASALSLPSGEYIWVDKGSYCIGDQIRISFYMPGTGDVKIWDHTPGGRTILIYSDEQEGKESTYRTMTARVEGPSGTETLEIEISEGCWPQPCFGLGWWTDSVSFFVEDCDPCRNVTCEPDCFGCDYCNTKCEDGDCVRGSVIESNSSRCGSECGGKVVSEEKERDQLYQAYADALDGNLWANKASEVMKYFSEWYYSSFEEPYNVVKSSASGVVYSKYDAAEAATYELCTLVAFIKCTDTSYCLNTAYTEANVTGVPGRFREISSLIKKGEQNKALSRIDSLYNDIWEAHQHISQAGFAKNEEFVAQLFESGMKFLDAECENLGGKCNYPDPIPHEPKSPICTGTGLLSIMIVLGILIHWKRH